MRLRRALLIAALSLLTSATPAPTAPTVTGLSRAWPENSGKNTLPVAPTENNRNNGGLSEVSEGNRGA